MSTETKKLNIVDTIYNNLFPYEEGETKGGYYYFRFFEIVVLIYMANFAWDWGHYIQKIGDVVLPLGIANYIDVSFMFDNNISLINGAIMVVAGLLGFFRITKFGYLACFLAFHLHYTSRYCLGEISHGSNLIGMCIFILALMQLTQEEGPKGRIFAMGMVLFYFGFGYTSAGICKMVATGPVWIDGSHLWMWIGERSVDVTSRSGSWEPNILQSIALGSYPAATLILFFGLVTELGAFLIWFRKIRHWVVVFLIGMHMGISISMNIMFMENMIILIVVMYPWGKFIDKFLPKQQPQEAISEGA